MKVHRRYWDKQDRPDLRSLAVCNNINGPICKPEFLTSDDAKVTCGLCRRFRESVAVPRKAFTPAMLRKNSRALGRPAPPSLLQACRQALELIGRATVDDVTLEELCDCRDVLKSAIAGVQQ